MMYCDVIVVKEVRYIFCICDLVVVALAYQRIPQMLLYLLLCNFNLVSFCTHLLRYGLLLPSSDNYCSSPLIHLHVSLIANLSMAVASFLNREVDQYRYILHCWKVL